MARDAALMRRDPDTRYALCAIAIGLGVLLAALLVVLIAVALPL